MPSGITVSVLADRTETVRASVEDVQFTLVLTIALVVAVIYLFLGSLRATIIPGVAVPLSLVGTFGVMHLLGYSLNNLSLMALTISSGFVVDDDIVMVENVSRFIELGRRPFDAALEGARQIGFTIVSLTVSLVAVLIPLLFMGGLVGRLFREFAVTLAVAIGVSALVSLTLTAMMCAWLLEPHGAARPNPVTRAFERGFDALTRLYARTLKVVLRHRATTLLVTCGTVALTAWLALVVPKGFFPVEDTGLVVGVSEVAPDASFARVMERQQAAAEVLLADPDVATVASFVGADGTNATSNAGRFSIALQPRRARAADAPAIIARLQARLAAVEGIRVWLQPVQDLTIDNRVARTAYQYTLEDADPDELATWAARLEAAMRADRRLASIASDQILGGQQLALTIDRDSAARLGVTAQAIDDTLYDAFGQRQVSTIFTQLNLYRVILTARPEDQKSPDALARLYVRSSTGGAIPLSSFVTMTTRTAPLAITHQGQFPSVTLSFEPARGVSLGDAVAAIREVQATIGLPPSVRASFQGTAQAFGESLAGAPLLILAALLTVYIVLGVLYESTIHPSTILSTLPSAGVGAFLALMVSGAEFTVIALIGIILLIGIDGGAPRRAAARARQRHRERAAPPARHHHRRRAHSVADPHALHDAGHLSGDGAAAGAPRRSARAGADFLMDDKSPDDRGDERGLSAPFIRRPVATALLAAAIFLAGAVGFSSLPVAPLPRVDFPTVSVSANLPGASPETMASSVATPLERRFGRIAGVIELTSTSTLGATTITMQFDLDRDVEAAARDVQAAINAAGGELPPALPFRPSYRKVNPADAPILIIGLRSKTLPLPRVFDAANTILAQKISQVPGVGQVFVGGGQQPAVRVQLDPLALAGVGLTLEDVRAALRAQTANAPKGAVADEAQAQVIAANDQLSTARQWSDVIVRYQEGAAVRLGDVARVVDSVENERAAGWSNGERTVVCVVRRQPGANIIDVIARVRAILPELVAAMSPAIDVEVALDRAATIRASVHEVESTLVLSVCLVVVVVFVFLRSARATVIPSVAVPLSLVGTFGVMALLGYSLDNLSLMALTISTGFVVDDAIVVTENVARWVEEGVPPLRAALRGAREIAFTIVSITASLLAVFIPILLMGGVVGRLFREFAVTLSIAITVSALLSLTLTLMMCARLLRGPEAFAHRPGPLARALERGFAWLQALYARRLRFVLRHRRATGVVTLATIALTVVLYVIVPKGLFPQQDTGFLTGFADAPQDISYPALKQRMEALNAVLVGDPAIDHVVTFIGGNGGSAGNTGTMFIALKDKPPRAESADAIIARLRPKLARVSGITLFLQAVQDLRIGGRMARTQYQYTLRAADLEALRAWAPRLVAKLKTLPELRDVASDQQTAGLSLALTVDRDAAARLGVSARAVDDTLYDAFGQRQVATMYGPQNQYRVVMEMTPQLARGPEAIERLFLPSATGGPPVPMGSIARATTSATSISVNHESRFPAVTLSFNAAPGVALGQAVEAIERARRELGMPATITATYAGTARAFRESLASEPWLILAALVTVYLVLGILYESFIHPLTILSTLPSAGVGALLALMAFQMELSVIALIGILLLVGIVKKNAILMIDFAIEAERTEGLSAAAAIEKACLLRFRPILMTTLAALLGAVPLAVGGGVGAELRQPLGVTIIGGLAFSQVLTLFTTPVVYLALDRFTRARRVGVATV